jgi:hypothetical protein
LAGIDEFIERFLQFEEANFKSFEMHNSLAAGSTLATARAFYLLMCHDAVGCRA